MNVNVGIDIGSTTVKIVVVRDGEIIHKHYERHFSKVREKAVELVRAARGLIGEDTPLRCSITGSAGLGVAKAAGHRFRTGGVRHRASAVERARSATPMLSLSWAARTRRSSSSPAGWRSA